MSARHWTRRHLGRELQHALSRPFGVLVEKGDRAGRWSQFRLILLLFAVGYVRWVLPRPDALTAPVVALGACILFALPVRDLFRAVPAAEALGALEAFFGSVMRRPGTGPRSVGTLVGPTAAAAEGPGTLTAEDLIPPVAHARPEPEEEPQP